MKNKTIIPLILLIVLILVSGCSPSGQPQAENKLQITVSVLPEKYFVERIGGDRVSLNVMVWPGDSPHTYEPKPDQMAALSRSALYFAIGVEFENAWMDKIGSANPQLNVIDLSEGIEKIPIPAHPDENDERAEDESQILEKGELDPHIWTSPEMAKDIARKIAEQLDLLDTKNADFYQANLGDLLREIELLQNDIRVSLENVQNRRFLVFHPAWGYFAREFQLEEIAIEVGGSEPSASELQAIIDTAKNEGIRVVFAQPEFSTQIADYIAGEINGQVILISPLAENWLENLRLVADSFGENL